MSAMEEHKEELEHYEQMLGQASRAAGGVVRPVDAGDGAGGPTRGVLPRSARRE